jgi:Mycothiol maleylpyruvate isomerase N-terminal domain
MGPVVADMEAVRQAAETIAGRVAAMVRDLPDASIQIPHSQWSVSEAAAHLAYANLGMAMMARGMEIPHGDGTRDGLAEANKVALEGFTERDGAVLADRMVAGARMVFDEAAAQPPDRVCPTPMGPMPVATLISYLLVHEAMHGSAIATAVGAPWPFDPEHVALMWPFMSYVLPRVADVGQVAGLTACFELRFGDALHCALMVDDGAVTMSLTPARPPDCIVAGDAQSLFLVIVRVLTMQGAVESADLRLSGPSPELGLRMPDLFNVP